MSIRNIPPASDETFLFGAQCLLDGKKIDITVATEVTLISINYALDVTSLTEQFLNEVLGIEDEEDLLMALTVSYGEKESTIEITDVDALPQIIRRQLINYTKQFTYVDIDGMGVS